MSQIELHFPVLGTEIPADHAYALYSAICRHVPKIHTAELPLRIGPIRGVYQEDRTLRLDDRLARLRVRLRAEDLPLLLPLAGKSLDLGGRAVRLGVPQVTALIPAPALMARLVTIKKFTEPGQFVDAARRQLDALNIHAEIGIPIIQAGPREGQPRRRVLRIKEKRIVGFPLQVTGLTAEESIRLQEGGIGGRAKMGCGFFVPVKEGKK